MWIWPQVQTLFWGFLPFAVHCLPLFPPHLEIVRGSIKVAKQDRRKKSKTKIRRPHFGMCCLTLTSCLRPSR